MADLTSDAGHAASDHVAARRRSAKTEFTVYFAIIFLAALPLAVLTWALQAARQRRLDVKGPVARAWSQARIITPMIFSA